MADLPDVAAGPPRAEPFAPTQWSLVLLACDRASPQADAALATLCRTYWYPLSAYIRRQVPTTEQAEDLTQEFFARLLEKDFLRTVDPGRGRFRAFLLACCKHFLANERDRAGAAKRGGGCAILSLDFATAADRYRREPADTLTPEKLFERRWAMTLLEQALEQLGQEFARSDRGEVFERLKGTLVGGADTASDAQIGAALGMTEAAVKKAAQRLRERYRAILRELIAATVGDPARSTTRSTGCSPC
jgi:DNA-directed RNA polymerase specialized sigma24 family protein